MAYLDETGLARVWSKVKAQVTSLTNAALSVKSPITIQELKTILQAFPGQPYPAIGTTVTCGFTSPITNKRYTYEWEVVQVGYRQTSAGNKWGATLFAKRCYHTGNTREDRVANNAYCWYQPSSGTFALNSTTWESGVGRSWLNNTFLGYFDSDFRAAAQSVSVDHQRCTAAGVYSKVNTNDKLYLPSLRELRVASSEAYVNAVDAQGAAYQLGTPWNYTDSCAGTIGFPFNWDEISDKHDYYVQYPLRNLMKNNLGTANKCHMMNNWAPNALPEDTEQDRRNFYISWRPVCFVAN